MNTRIRLVQLADSRLNPPLILFHSQLPRSITRHQYDPYHGREITLKRSLVRLDPHPLIGASTNATAERGFWSSRGLFSPCCALPANTPAGTMTHPYADRVQGRPLPCEDRGCSSLTPTPLSCGPCGPKSKVGLFLARIEARWRGVQSSWSIRS